MSGSGWSTQHTLRGLAAFALMAAVGAIYLWTYKQEHADQRQAAAADQREQINEQRQSTCVDVAKRHSFPCVVDAPVSEPSEKYTQYDLQAQQDMAEWALLMALLSGLGVAVTITATIYVAKTLDETRRMVVEAERTTKAAEETIAVTRDMARDQSRAYVHAAMAEVFWDDDHPAKLSFEAQNTGQTPVKWYGYRCHAVLDDLRFDSPFPRRTVMGKPLARWSYLPNGVTVRVVVHDRDVLKSLHDAKVKGCAFRLDGIISYETFFGEQFQTEFSFYSQWLGGNHLGTTESGTCKPIAEPLKCSPRHLKTYEKMEQS